MKYEKLHYDVEDGICKISMNYYDNLNAIDEQMAQELLNAINNAENDPKVKIVILRGAKEKAFSAGGDIGYFYSVIEDGGEVNMDTLFQVVGKVAAAIKRMSKLVITSVSGSAAGAGVSLAVAGDFMICTENTKIILAFVNLGLVPDTGATYLLCKSIGVQRTMELAATGRVMKADEAKQLGLAYQVVPVEELDVATDKLAKKLASGPLLSYKNIKKQIYDASYSDYEKWLSNSEQPTQRECVASEDFKEGVRAFIEKRKADFQGK